MATQARLKLECKRDEASAPWGAGEKRKGEEKTRGCTLEERKKGDSEVQPPTELSLRLVTQLGAPPIRGQGLDTPPAAKCLGESDDPGGLKGWKVDRSTA